MRCDCVWSTGLLHTSDMSHKDQNVKLLGVMTPPRIVTSHDVGSCLCQSLSNKSEGVKGFGGGVGWGVWRARTSARTHTPWEQKHLPWFRGFLFPPEPVCERKSRGFALSKVLVWVIFDHHNPEVLAFECIFLCFSKKSRELQNPGDGFLILLIRQGKPSIPGHWPPLSGDSAIAERSQPEGDALGMTMLHGGTEPAPSISTQSLLY
ncbi:uncharacterized protein LOC123813089 [Phyllostomus hastatus]|uniref:uncharacterized protein LOC123813089 n=1 Tax=Phyllostomus hastatus TaxID=9423 RepID=UPI001E682381|nr:uncharacterized protein LOC123813089 [Phyllostomus hastatus]